MTATELSRLESVDLRTVWQSEPGEFTPWLARPENVALLGETLGLELVVESREARVGPFRADIVCRDTGYGSPDGALVLIENQLGRTDHSHLGQLLTYAAGLDAVSVVWIAQPFTDEHREALDWLNRKTGQGVNFFGLEIELWKIADSPVAPKFNIVAKPNDWAPIVTTSNDISGIKGQQLEFWIEFEEFVRAKGSNINFRNPRPQHWMPHSIGRSGMNFSSIISAMPPVARVELVLTGDEAKNHFELLKLKQESIEEEIGADLNWRNPPNAKRAVIEVKRELDFRIPSEREEAKEWLYDNLVRFHEVLKPRALALDAPDRPPAQFTSLRSPSGRLAS